MHRISLPFAEVWVRDEQGRLPTAEQLRRFGFRVSSIVCRKPPDHLSETTTELPPGQLGLPLGRSPLALPWVEEQS